MRAPATRSIFSRISRAPAGPSARAGPGRSHDRSAVGCPVTVRTLFARSRVSVSVLASAWRRSTVTRLSQLTSSDVSSTPVPFGLDTLYAKTCCHSGSNSSCGLSQRPNRLNLPSGQMGGAHARGRERTASGWLHARAKADEGRWRRRRRTPVGSCGRSTLPSAIAPCARAAQSTRRTSAAGLPTR